MTAEGLYYYEIRAQREEEKEEREKEQNGGDLLLQMRIMDYKNLKMEVYLTA